MNTCHVTGAFVWREPSHALIMNKSSCRRKMECMSAIQGLHVAASLQLCGGIWRNSTPTLWPSHKLSLYKMYWRAHFVCRVIKLQHVNCPQWTWLTVRPHQLLLRLKNRPRCFSSKKMMNDFFSRQLDKLSFPEFLSSTASSWQLLGRGGGGAFSSSWVLHASLMCSEIL